jgi:DNA polymerase I
MPTLYLIDGYGQFFRAFHAIRTPMTSPVTGEPTNMTFGFVGMLLKLVRGEGPNMQRAGGAPDYIAVALDVSGDRGTFRTQIYPDYKANRDEAPELIGPQIDRCLAMLQEIGVPLLGAEGFEADDVIATLVTRLRQQHPELRIRIVAKDKDMKQLLEQVPAEGGGVEMYDVHTDTLIDEECFQRDTGISPRQWIDALALMGDTIDNVPGVPGVGDKTATLLIREYGSLDNLLARASEIKGKRGENVRAAAALLPMSRQLVTLRHDAPVKFELESARTARLELERLLPICRELGFNRYQDEVKSLLGSASQPLQPAQQQAPAPRASTGMPSGGLYAENLFEASAPAEARHIEGDYRCIRTREELRELIAQVQSAPVIGLDTETTTLSPLDARLCGISISIRPGTGVYIPVRSPEPEKHLDETTVLDALRPILEDPRRPKAGHNLKFDLLVLRTAGIDLRGISHPTIAPESPERKLGVSSTANIGATTVPPAPPTDDAGELPVFARADDSLESACDSMIASYLIDSSRSSHALDALALALLKRTNIPISELIGTGRNQRCFDCVPLDQATPYAAEDADVALQLREYMLPQLRAMGLMDLWQNVELPLVEVLAELEWNGITVDPTELDRQRQRLEGRISELRSRIDRASLDSIGRTFNPDSPRQLAAALFNKPADSESGLGIRPPKRTKTGYSTDIEVLEKLAGDVTLGTPIPALIVEYRQLSKLVGTYLEALKAAINSRTRRIHASFNQTVAATGRLSSSDPNLQNIPIRTDIGREIRRAFIAPPGHLLISADYSQIELRLLAHLARDPNLIEAFRRGEDIHTAVAAQIHGVPLEQVTREQRGGAKMVNFGIVYGITPFGLARRLGIDEKHAAEIITSYKQRFAGITTFLEECIAQAQRFGYVETMLKRRRPILGINARNPSERALAQRMAINSVVQGSAADLIKLAMIDLHARLSQNAPHWRRGRPPQLAGVKMLLQIHDELVFEAPEDVAEEARQLIVSRMEIAMQIAVPLRVDSAISRNWFEGK